MKVRLFVLLAITLAVLGAMAITAGSVNADAGPHRKQSSVTPSNCADCHRAHTGSGSNILAYSSAYALCTTCHGPTDTIQDVVDGVFNFPGGTAQPLRGGGFAHVTMNNTDSGAAVGNTPTTSAHAVVGMPGYVSNVIGDTVWGFGALGTANAGISNFALQCSTCHDPHGGSGAGGVATYRILRSDLSQKLGFSVTPVTVADTAGSHVYTISDLTTDLYYGQTYSSVNDANSDNNLVSGPSGISQWCAECHTRIHAAGGLAPETTSSTDTIFNFRHRTDGNNVAFNFNPLGPPVNNPGAAPSCFTCHVSHGSNASNASFGGPIEVPFPGTAEGGGQYLDSSLLRLDKRGVCEACHNK
jgi:predicted CXXCH cytochrome family protein